VTPAHGIDLVQAHFVDRAATENIANLGRITGSVGFILFAGLGYHFLES
jgi:hypothetical protein